MKISGRVSPFDDISIWTVWYEDRFGLGPDRDPGSILALCMNKKDAEHYINTHGGSIDSERGRSDGLFLRKWLASEIINAGIADLKDIQRLLQMHPPKQLLKHWEKGWI